MASQDYLQDPKTGKMAGSTAGARKAPKQRANAPVEFADGIGSPATVVARTSRWFSLGPKFLGSPGFGWRTQSELEHFANNFIQTAETAESTHAIAIGPFLFAWSSRGAVHPGAGDLDRKQAGHLFTKAFPYGATLVTLGKMMIARRAPQEGRVAPAYPVTANPYETSEERGARELVREVRLASMPRTVREALEQARSIRP
jgi:hypothetical protein